MCNSERFHVWTLRYSLRRVSHLDSVKCDTHNPKVGGSSPPNQRNNRVKSNGRFHREGKKRALRPTPSEMQLTRAASAALFILLSSLLA